MSSIRSVNGSSMVRRLFAWLHGWWAAGYRHDRYLTAATDLPDLERRIKSIERGYGGPLWVTFNH